MIVEENTTYYKNESADGFYFDEHFNIIGLSESEGKAITTPSGCKYYQTSLTYGIAHKFYVSTEDVYSPSNDVPHINNDIKNAISNDIKNDTIITYETNSSSLNTRPSSDEAVVIFIDDDGKSAVYTSLYPLLRKRCEVWTRYNYIKNRNIYDIIGA